MQSSIPIHERMYMQQGYKEEKTDLCDVHAYLPCTNLVAKECQNSSAESWSLILIDRGVILELLVAAYSYAGSHCPPRKNSRSKYLAPRRDGTRPIPKTSIAYCTFPGCNAKSPNRPVNFEKRVSRKCGVQE